MRKQHLLAVLFFAVLTGLIFWKFFLYGLIQFPGDYLVSWYEPWKTDTFVGAPTIAHKAVADDVFRHLYPLRVLAFDLIKQLKLPLWNPYNGAGTPLLAIMHPGYLNPFGVVFFFLPSQLAWSIFVALQPLLLGFCTYLYCRKIKLRHEAALFAGAVLIFSGFVIARLLYGEFIYLLSALPILLLLIEDAFTSDKSILWILASPVVFFLFLSGQPHMVLYILLFIWCYGVYRYIQIKPVKHIRRVAIFCFLILLGIGMAGIQLVPSFELYANSTITRASSQFIFQRFLLPLTHLITIAIPNYFGNQATYNWWGIGDYIETVASIGLIPLFFTYIALIHKRSQKDPRRFFFGSAIVTILLTLDWFGTRWLFSLPIPVLSADVPSRIFVLTTVSIVVLAGYGLDAWQRNSLKFSKTIWFLIFVGVITVVTAGLAYFRPMCPVVEIPNCWNIALRNTVLEVGAFTALIIGLLLFRKQWLIPLVLVIVLGLYNSNKFLPFSSKDSVLPDNSLIQALKERTRDGRVFGIGGANLKTNFATHFRIYDPNYYDPLHIKRYAEFIGYANSGEYPPKLLRSDVELVSDGVNNRALDLLSVRYLIYKKSEVPIKNTNNVVWENEHWYIEKRNTVLPRAYLVNDVEVIGDDRVILQRLFDPVFDPQSSVILERQPSAQARFPEFPPAGRAGKLPQFRESGATIKEYGEQQIMIEAITDKPALLVLTDTFYSGWKAYVDDQQALIYRANYALRAVEVPTGRHTVRFVYKPMSVTVGGWVTMGSFAVYGLIVLLITKPRVTMRKNI